MLTQHEASNVNVGAMLQYLRIAATNQYGEWKAPCPNHTEKEPSWSIRDDVGRPNNAKHWCFGCGFGGGPVSLVRHVMQIGHHAACDLIRERFVSGSITPSSIKLSFARRHTFSMPADVIFKPMNEWLSFPMAYAASRGITSVQVDKWRIGYSHRGRLAGRIVIPIYDYNGVPCSYTARTYIDADIRYMTPSADEHFDEGAIFGEQEWPSPGARNVLLVSEGALDALALERALPFTPVASFQGTKNVNVIKISKLASFKRIVVVTDADRAGSQAYDTIRSSTYRHVEGLYRVVLPDGEDPNSVSSGLLREAVLRSRFFQ